MTGRMIRWIGFPVLLGTMVLGGTDWPMWGYDAARSGASPAIGELPATLHLQWMRELPPPRRAWPKQWDDGDKLEFDLSYSPVVKDGRVFVASMSTDTLTAYDARTGRELWRFYGEGPFRVAPAAWEDSVYAACDDGRLYCLDAVSGEKRWVFDGTLLDRRVLGNNRIISMWPARGGPLVMDGTVYFASGIWPFLGTMVYALDARTGDKLWANTGHATEWQLQPHGGAYAFAGLAPQGYLAAQGDRLVVAGGRGMPSLFDLRDGSLVDSRIQHHKGSGGYRVRIRDGSYYNHGVRLDLRDGRVQGREDYEHPAWSALQERVNALRDDLQGNVFESLAADGRLYVVTDCGRLYCFGATAPAAPRIFAYDPVAPRPSETEAGKRAAEILKVSGVSEGYALVMGAQDLEWIEQLAARSDLRLVVIDPDAERVTAARRRLSATGLYGGRVALLRGSYKDMHFPRYIFSLVMALDPDAAGWKPDSALFARLFEHLRPYGGRAYLGFDPDQDAVRSALSAFDPENGRILTSSERRLVAFVREGALPGSGQWTHQYADSAQSVLSRDFRVRAPFGPIWFGGPTHNNVLPRHAAGPRPQVAEGRLVIMGVDAINARCVFTGRELWMREFPGIGHAFTNLELEERWSQGEAVYMVNQPGASYIGSPYVTLSDGVYLRHRNRIHRLDPATGEEMAVWSLPMRSGEEDTPDWGHISICDDFLITTLHPHIFRGGALGTHSDDRWDATSSERLAVLNRHSGRVLWTRDAATGFRHNAIASANGVLFVNDLLSEEALGMARRRGIPVAGPPRLYALDLRNGRVLWSEESEVFGTFLSYSAEHDVLIEGGSRDGRRPMPDEPTDRMIARRGRDGKVLWERDGRYDGPVILLDDMIIPGRPGAAICLRTGGNAPRQHPVTGKEETWSYWRTYGCGTANASPHLLLFRSGAAGFTDLEHDGGTGTLGGFRSGCTASMIPADGILNAPDYTRTCTCSYQNQTSLGLVHMPEMEMWTFNRAIRRVEGTIQRVGLNLGAPGDRRADNGTLWLHVPARAPTLEVDVLLADTVPDEPRRVVSVRGVSSAGSYPEFTLDGDMDSQWRISCGRRGDYRGQGLTFELSEPVMLDRIHAAWSGPIETRYSIATSTDGERWTTLFEGQGEGAGRDFETYFFDPVKTRFVRWSFGEHADTREDSRGRRIARGLSVYQVRLGDLPFPDSYVYYTPRDFFRKHALAVHAGQGGINWVGASGILNVEELVLRGVNGGGHEYDVILHFLEPEQARTAQRRFDIGVGDRTVVQGFDVVHSAGGPNRAITCTLNQIPIHEDLRLTFTPELGSAYPPILSGVEIVRRP